MIDLILTKNRDSHKYLYAEQFNYNLNTSPILLVHNEFGLFRNVQTITMLPEVKEWCDKNLSMFFDYARPYSVESNTYDNIDNFAEYVKMLFGSKDDLMLFKLRYG